MIKLKFNYKANLYDSFSHGRAHVYVFLEIVSELYISKELKFLLSLTILLEWQLYMYLCILNVGYVLLYTLVRQKYTMLTYLIV